MMIRCLLVVLSLSLACSGAQPSRSAVCNTVRDTHEGVRVVERAVAVAEEVACAGAPMDAGASVSADAGSAE